MNLFHYPGLAMEFLILRGERRPLSAKLAMVLGAVVVAGVFPAVADTNEYAFSTVAGAAPGAVDGVGSAARFNEPQGVAVDAAGNVFVTDAHNYTIRKITADGAVSTLAGLAGAYGSVDGVGGSARFNLPRGIALDGSGNVYVADGANNTIRKITPDRVVTTLAGLAGEPGSVDGNGRTARFNFPEGIAVDQAGTVYVTDLLNETIRKITANGRVSTLAGSAGQTGSADGAGSAARFNLPSGLVVDNG